jgi:mono/diheme cytochrome c family protein
MSTPISNQAPPKKSPPKSVAVLGLLSCVAALLVPWLLTRNEPPAGLAGGGRLTAAGPALARDPMSEGETVFQRSCVGCHDAKGGASVYPPLAGSPWLLDDVETPIRIVIAGVTGPLEVQGVKYDGVMPNLGVTLTDAQIANVLTYARASFGNRAMPISEAQVTAVRAKLGPSPKPFAGGAGLVEARQTVTK